jgi:hypothetical protein
VAEYSENGPFVIRELTGEGRRIELAGWAAPHKPFTLSGSQRAEFTWFQGSGVASVQVLGPEEEASTLRGYWHDRYLMAQPTGTGSFATLKGVPIASVDALVKLFSDVRRKGQLLEVSWLTTKRHGLLTKFTETWQTFHDVEWEAEFKWTSFGETQGDQILAVREQDLSEVAQTTAADYAALRQTAVPSFARAFEFTASLNHKIEALRGSASSLIDAATGAANGSLGAIDTARRAVSLLSSIAGQAKDAIESVYEHGDESCVGLIGDPAKSRPTLGQTTRVALSNRRIVHQARMVRHNAARARRRMTAMASPDLAISFVARDDQDLREVAVTYYGDASAWRTIATHNGMRTSKLTAGQVVMVPNPRNAGAQR